MTFSPPARPIGRPAPGAASRLRVTPGRRLALLVGMPVLLALLGWTAFSAVAQVGQATYAVHLAIPVTGGQVSVELQGGDMTLQQAAIDDVHPGTAELTGTARYSLIRSRIAVSGSTVRYQCPVPTGNCSLTGTLVIPRGTGVSLSTGGGDLHVGNGFTAGRLTLSTAGGDLSARELAGVMDLSTGGGDLRAASINGALHAVSSGGDVSIGSLEGNAAASITSGGGDVYVACAAVPGGSLQISSSGGDVTVVLPRGQYRLSVTTDGGDYNDGVSNDTSARNSVTVDSGGGDVTIRYASLQAVHEVYERASPVVSGSTYPVWLRQVMAGCASDRLCWLSG